MKSYSITAMAKNSGLTDDTIRHDIINGNLQGHWKKSWNQVAIWSAREGNVRESLIECNKQPHGLTTAGKKWLASLSSGTFAFQGPHSAIRYSK
jgi:hypothetical protein